MHRVAVLAAVLVNLAFFSCDDAPDPVSEPSTVDETEATAVDVTGLWRAVLESPGGELPFTLELEEGRGSIHNGEERAPIESVVLEGRQVTLGFERFAARIDAELSDDGERLAGTWHKRTSSGESSLPFVATRGEAPRFSADGPSEPALAVGDWAVTFTDDDGPFVARGEFREEHGRLLGTFLTATGDYRYLEGDVIDGELRLSTFDGAHAFLFTGRFTGRFTGLLTIEGHFYSRDRYHATWTGRRLGIDQADELPDPFSEVRVTSEDQRLRFSFPSLSGERIAMPSERFDGKVVLIDLFGSWCPNCADQAPLIERWQERYGPRGLEVVAIGYELTGTDARAREQLERWRDRYRVTHPILLGGVNQKDMASQTLPDLSPIRSYPTTILVGRDGRVHRIYSGFAGPATGAHHTAMVERLEREIESLLSPPI